MLYIIQNDPEVLCGNLVEFITCPYQLCRLYQHELLPDPDQVSALIVLGGAMGANDDDRYPFLADLKKLIRQVVTRQIPYLGICLGGQLLAAALDVPVVSNRWAESGTLPVQLTEAGRSDLLFSGIAEQFTTFQWHNDSFDLPDKAILLASSVACPNQAFRYGENAWGLQFHPEVTSEIIRCWAACAPAIASQAEALVVDFTAQVTFYRQTTQQMLDNFLQLSAN